MRKKNYKKVSFNYKRKKLTIDVRVCNLFERVRGLMFRKRKEAEALLLFDFKKPRRVKIHSFFVFFPFIALWLDDKNRVVDLKVIKPFTLKIKPKKPFNKLIEIPINDKYSRIINFSSVIKNIKN